jgi:hypothetical protein
VIKNRIAKMQIHPTRKKLKMADILRLDKVIKKQLDDSHATTDEIDPALDILYDAAAAKMQTHEGVLTLQ